LGQILRRVGGKLSKATAAAEIIRPSVVLMTMLRLIRIDDHPAHGIAHVILRLPRFVGVVPVRVIACRGGHAISFTKGLVSGTR
jgi:hypothetical protein